MQGVRSIGLIPFLTLLSVMVGSFLFILFSYEGPFCYFAFIVLTLFVAVFFGSAFYKYLLGVAPLEIRLPFSSILNGMSRHYIGPEIEVCVTRTNPRLLSHFPVNRNKMIVVIGRELLNKIERSELENIYGVYFSQVYKSSQAIECRIRLFLEILYRSLLLLQRPLNWIHLGEVYGLYLKTFFKIGESLSFKDSHATSVKSLDKKSLYYGLSLLRRHIPPQKRDKNMFLDALELTSILKSYWEDEEALEQESEVIYSS